MLKRFKTKIMNLIYSPFAWAFYWRARHVRLLKPLVKEINLRALDILHKHPKLVLNSLDEGFSKEFSIYGFREAINSYVIFNIIKRDKPCFLDVGANIGYYSVIACVAGAPLVIAIEPVPLTFHFLKLNMFLTRKLFNCKILTFNVALSTTDGFVKIVIPHRYYNLAYVSEEESQGAVKVKALTILSLIKELRIAQMIQDTSFLMKMDLEGFEGKLLLQSEIPKCIQWIDIEVHPHKYDPLRLVEKMRDKGFRLQYFIGDIPFGLYPVVNYLGLKRSLKILKDFYILEELPTVTALKRYLKVARHPYFIFSRV